MFDLNEIDAMERRLSDAGLTVSDLCREAKIAETTWGRWKRGDFFPSWKKAQAVSAAMNGLLPPTENSK